MTTRKSFRKPAARRPRQVSARTNSQTVWLVFVALLMAGLCLYPPWSNVWTNFEGFHLRAPLVYAFVWAPPPPVFPAARSIDVWRLGEELAVAAVAGFLVYRLLGAIGRR